MKLFGIALGSKKEDTLQVTADDREWVESNFQWLVKINGHPKSEQISITDEWFPETYKAKNITIDNLIKDCCNHLELSKDLFSYEILEDIRDTATTPYAFEERPVDCSVHFDKLTRKYKIALAKNLLEHPIWLISRLCYEFAKVKLIIPAKQ